jgi:hypothetical protein
MIDQLPMAVVVVNCPPFRGALTACHLHHPTFALSAVASAPCADEALRGLLEGSHARYRKRDDNSSLLMSLWDLLRPNGRHSHPLPGGNRPMLDDREIVQPWAHCSVAPPGTTKRQRKYLGAFAAPLLIPIRTLARKLVWQIAGDNGTIAALQGGRL